MKRRLAFLSISLLLCAIHVIGQNPNEISAQNKLNAETENQIEVFGKVVDEKGNPLLFATVQIKEISLVIETDINGEFKLILPKSEIYKCYEVSARYVAYLEGKKDVCIGNKKVIEDFEIVLKDDVEGVGIRYTKITCPYLISPFRIKK